MNQTPKGFKIPKNFIAQERPRLREQNLKSISELITPAAFKDLEKLLASDQPCWAHSFTPRAEAVKLLNVDSVFITCNNGFLNAVATLNA